MADRGSPSGRMLRRVGEKQQRMMRRRADKTDPWSSLAVFGSIGWSVAIPTIIGVALGVWIDSRWPGRFSWTLMLLIGGLLLGCLSAWMHISGGGK